MVSELLFFNFKDGLVIVNDLTRIFGEKKIQEAVLLNLVREPLFISFA